MTQDAYERIAELQERVVALEATVLGVAGLGLAFLSKEGRRQFLEALPAFVKVTVTGAEGQLAEVRELRAEYQLNRIVDALQHLVDGLPDPPDAAPA
jgi:hypothetical protein